MRKTDVFMYAFFLALSAVSIVAISCLSAVHGHPYVGVVTLIVSGASMLNPFCAIKELFKEELK